MDDRPWGGPSPPAVGPNLLHPSPQHGIAKAKFPGHRSDRAATQCNQINRLPLVVVRKRPTLTSFHPTPPGSQSLLQVSINSEEVHLVEAGHDALLELMLGRYSDVTQDRLSQLREDALDE